MKNLEELGNKILERVNTDNDIHNSRKKIKSAINRLLNMNIPQENKEDILKFIEYKQITSRISIERTRFYIEKFCLLCRLLESSELANKKFREYTKEDVIKVVDMIITKPTWTEWTQVGIKQCLKYIIRFINNKFEDYEPCPLVDWIKLTVKVPNRIRSNDLVSEEEKEKILSVCKTLRDKALVVLLFEGLRPKEICSLRVGDIDLEKGTIEIFQSKVRKSYVKLVNPKYFVHIVNLIKTHPFRKNPNAFLLLKRDKKPMDYQYVRHQLYRLLKRANINRKITLYLFRHTYTTELIRKGVPMNIVKNQTGHTETSKVVEQYYMHLNNDDYLNEMRKFYNGDSIVTCPVCFTETSIDSIYCSNCGRKLNDAKDKEKEIKDSIKIIKFMMEALRTLSNKDPALRKEIQEIAKRTGMYDLIS